MHVVGRLLATAVFTAASGRHGAATIADAQSLVSTIGKER